MGRRKRPTDVGRGRGVKPRLSADEDDSSSGQDDYSPQPQAVVTTPPHLSSRAQDDDSPQAQAQVQAQAVVTPPHPSSPAPDYYSAQAAVTPPHPSSPAPDYSAQAVVTRPHPSSPVPGYSYARAVVKPPHPSSRTPDKDYPSAQAGDSSSARQDSSRSFGKPPRPPSPAQSHSHPTSPSTPTDDSTTWSPSSPAWHDTSGDPLLVQAASPSAGSSQSGGSTGEEDEWSNAMSIYRKKDAPDDYVAGSSKKEKKKKKKKENERNVGTPDTTVDSPPSTTALPGPTRSVVDHHLPPGQNDTERLLEFLNKFVAVEGSDASYPSFISFVEKRGNFNVEIDFQELMWHDQSLAIKICKMSSTKRNEIILPIVKAFLVSHSIRTADVAKATLSFSDIPEKIERVNNFLVRDDLLVKGVKDIIHEGNIIPVMSGMPLFLLEGYLTYLFSQQKKGLSWHGGFDLDDLVVVDRHHCLIIKQPKYFASKSELQKATAADLNRLQDLFSPCLARAVTKLREAIKNTSGGKETVQSGMEYPLYYRKFRQELREVLMNPQVLGLPWFMEYMLNHPLLRSSIARHNFVSNTNLNAQFKHDDSKVKEILTSQSYMNLSDEDWRVNTRESRIPVVSEIYKFEFPQSNKKKNKTKDKKKGKHDADTFNEGFGGLVKYNRHFLQHAHLYVPTSSITMTEVSCSNYLPPYLPDLFKEMLAKGLMKQEEFEVLWRDYKLSGVHRMDGTSGGPEPRETISFWRIPGLCFTEKEYPLVCPKSDK